MSWRKNLNKGIKPYVEKLVRESFLYSNEYKNAEDKGKAQLWIALALLSKQLSELESRLKFFEAILKEISPKKAIKIRQLEKTEAIKDEIEKIFKNIVQDKPMKPPITESKAKNKTKARISKRKKGKTTK